MAGVLIGVTLMLTLLALLGGYGEDAARALDAYERYLPGNGIPRDAECRPMNEYHDTSGAMCVFGAAPYCERGYLIVRAGIITYVRLTGCDFPAAYLIADYGRPRRMTRFRRVGLLVWEGMSAQVRNSGWFNSMQPVSSVGWWKEVEASIVSS
jgi:hypothetical protein